MYKRQDKRAHDLLIEALDNQELVIQQAAIAALGENGDLEAVDHILKFALSEDWLMRQKLAEALGNISTPKSISALKYLEKDTHPQVSQTARISLRNLLSPG